MKPAINVEDEYYQEPVEETQEPAPADDTDIEVTPEQMAAIKQMAADQNFEGIGRLIAGLLTAAPAATPMM